MPVTLTQTGITFSDGASLTTNPVPAGSVMLFNQSSAPTGWTKSTTHNDKAMRVVSGNVGTGGNVSFTSALSNQSVSGNVDVATLSAGSTTLTTNQIPSHTHTTRIFTANNLAGGPGTIGSSTRNPQNSFPNTNTGGGASHSHSISGNATFSGGNVDIQCQYVDMIIATKD